jgi:hypothetical protein
MAGPASAAIRIPVNAWHCKLRIAFPQLNKVET